MGLVLEPSQMLVHLSHAVIPLVLDGDEAVNHQFAQEVTPLRVLVHGKEQLTDLLLNFSGQVPGGYQGRDAVRL
jgi:hypothetical protein